MKHKLLQCLMLIAALLTSTHAHAHDFEAQNSDGVTIYYKITADKTCAVTYKGTSYSEYIEYTGDVVIPESVTFEDATYSVTSIGDFAFNNCSGLSSVTIPNSVTNIGGSAFYNCSGLSSVTIPVSVTSIGDFAFRGCSGLTSITIPNSVTSIGDYAFYNCSDLTSITIPNSVTSIGDHAFYDCSGLTSIEIPNSVTSIGGHAFRGCSGLTYVELPSTLTSIGDYAFKSSNVITRTIKCDATVPPAVGQYAFEYNNLTIEVPFESVLDYKSVEGWSNVTIGSIKYKGKEVEGLYYMPISENEVEVTYKDSDYNSYSGSIVIPAEIEVDTKKYKVTRIGDNAFYNCSGLSYIELTGTLTSIGDHAFDNCSGLTSVAIPEGVTSIGKSAFYKCSGLTYIELPSTLTSIGNYAFSGYISSITRTIKCNATVPPAVGKNAFEYNYLTIEVPFESVLDYKAVEGWTNVTNGSIKYKCKEVEGLYYMPISENEVEVTYKDTNYNSYSGSIVIPAEIEVDTKKYKVTRIGDNAFSNCLKLNSVTIPEGVELIGDNAFYMCYELMDFIIPSTVTKIGENAFAFDYNRYMASEHGYCNVDRNVKCNAVNPPAVALNAFDYCKLTVEVSFESVLYYRAIEGWVKTNYGYKAYKGKEVEGLYYLPISEDEVEVTYKDSDYNSYTGDIVIPAEITANEKTYIVSSIGNSAFRDCLDLTSVTIPNCVTSIGDYAFKGCSGLTSVLELPSGIESIGNNCFSSTNYNVCRMAAMTPPTVTTNSLPSNISLVLVPAGSKTTYTADAVWGAYTIIEEGSCDIEVTNEVAGELTKSIFDQTRKNLSNVTSLIVHGTLNANDLEKVNTSLTSLLHLDISDTDVTEIAADAFLNKSTLMSIKLPKGLKSIGNSAFSGCSVLSEEFKLPETLEVIGDKAFENCIAINGVLCIPASVNSIGSYAFAGCRGINAVDMSKSGGLTSMLNNAFYNCSGLKKVDMSGVTELVALEQSMFKGCTSLKDINLSETLKIVRDYAFYGCSELDNLQFPASLQSVGHYAFQNCSKIKDLSFDGCEYLVSIGSYAFSNCAGLETLSFADCKSMTTFSSNIFSGCTSLKEVDMLGCTSITAVSDYMFSDCTSLQAVKLPSSMITLGSYVFKNCTGLEVVNLEGCKKLSNIYNTAFSGCTGLKLLDITECTSLRTINSNTFSTCSALETVNFPSSLTSIGASAFANCTNLQHMSVPCSTPPAIENNANPFAGVDNVACVLSIPSESFFNYYEANYWGGFVDIENKSDIQLEVEDSEESEEEGEAAEENDQSNGCQIYYERFVADNVSPALTLNEYKASLTEEGVEKIEISKAITGSGQSVFVGNGDAITFYFTPANGKEIDKVLYNGKDVTSELVENTYTTPEVNNVATLKVIMQAADLTGVDDTFVEECGVVELERYDISGRLLSSPVKGLNIVKMSDGSIRKMLVK